MTQTSDVSSQAPRAPSSARSIDAATRGSALTLVGTAVGAVANFGMLILVSRNYDETVFGVFAGVTSVFILAGVVLRLGGGVGAMYWISRARTFERFDLVPRLARIAIAPAAIGSVIATVAALIAAEPIASWLTDPAGADDFATMLRIAALVLPAWAVGQVLLGATRGLGSMRPTVYYAQVGRQAGQLVAVAIAIAIDASPTGLMIAWSVPYIPVLIGPALWIWRRTTQLEKQRRGDATYEDLSTNDAMTEQTRADREALDRPREAFWAYTFPQALNSAAQAGLEKFDVIVLGIIASTAEQGTYLVVNRVAHVVALALFSFGLALAPQLAATFARRAHREARILVATVTAWMLLLVGPVLWMVLLFPTPLLEVFGDDVGDGAPSLRIIAAGLLIIVMMGPTENLLLMSGGSATALLDNVAGLTLNVILNLVLVPEIGIRGSAIAWVTSVALVRLLALTQVWRRTRVRAPGRMVLIAGVVVAIAFGGVGITVSNVVSNGWGGLILAATLGLALYLLLLRLTRTELEIQQLQSSLRRPTAHA